MNSRTEPLIIRNILLSIALLFFGLFIVLPLGCVFFHAFDKGWQVYLKALQNPDALAAMRLTIITALVAVPLNLVFGVAASWAIAKFDFKGRDLLLSLIDLPLSVSPVIAGLIFMLIFGAQGFFGPWLRAHNVHIVFALPGIIIATVFVTFPMVARELIPIMKSQGNEEEEAALTLGASGWKTFWMISVPNIRWGILYGIILCNARAMGEFGAVSVVSGHIRGMTNTLPLHIEILYNEYQTTAAFAAASVLAMLAIVTLIAKTVIEAFIRKGHTA